MENKLRLRRDLEKPLQARPLRAFEDTLEVRKIRLYPYMALAVKKAKVSKFVGLIS